MGRRRSRETGLVLQRFHAHLVPDFFGQVEGGVGGRNAAVDRALHKHFLDLVAGHAVVFGRLEVQAQFAFAVHAYQHSDGDQAAGVARQAGAVPDIAPGAIVGTDHD